MMTERNISCNTRVDKHSNIFHHISYIVVVVCLSVLIPASTCEIVPVEVVPPTTNIVLNLQNHWNSSKPIKQSNDLEELESILFQYVDGALNRNYYEIVDGIYMAGDGHRTNSSTRKAKQNDNKSFDEKLIKSFVNFAETHVFNVNVGRAVQSGRLFFFKGLKKIMWPLLFGLQLIKTVLLVLFLPSIIGSLGKIVGKGLSSVSGLSQPATTVEDLDFKDNSFNSEQDYQSNGNDGYTYMPPDSQGAGSNNNYASHMYDAAQTNNVLSRLGYGGGRVTFVNSPIDYSKHRTSLSAKRDDFKTFHDIPNSSLLLTNYDPFYSPLLSRLDAVFQQMGIPKTEEKCREKLVCLMYSNPAKYAPYSNLISAQLSRELNELRKPSNDNPDILRFFKYMRAAKDGQDGADCVESFKDCLNFNEMTNPAMVTTFNDINKLVQARKM